MKHQRFLKKSVSRGLGRKIIYEKNEIQERKYLEEVKNKIKITIKSVDDRLERYQVEIKEDTIYRGENKDSMDGAEKIAFRQGIEFKVLIASQIFEQKKRLEKTSIALHRIAFLLYRFKDTLTAEDVLIISPNEVFADYISNVLPELGEEPVLVLCMSWLLLTVVKVLS